MQGQARDPIPIPVLTGARIFLALFVVFYHFGQRALVTSPTVLRNFAGSGYVSVSMFFLLSGYVLGYNYLGGRRIRLSAFWIARIARIAPAYLTAMGISLTLFAYDWFLHTASIASFTTIATALTCSNAWFAGLDDLWNFPAWSLSCECFFYFLFPFLAGPIMRVDRARLRRLIVGFGLLSMVPPLVYFLWLPDGVPWRDLTQMRVAHYTASPGLQQLQLVLRHGMYGVFMYNPFVHLPVFLLGMALGRYKLSFAEPRATLLTSLLPYAALLCILGLLAASGWMPHLVMHNGLAAVFFAAFVFHADALRGPVGRLLSASTVVLLGEASYGVYILQMPLWQLYVGIVHHVHLGTISEPTPAVLAGFLVFLCGSAVVTFLTVERFCRKRVRMALTSVGTSGRLASASIAGR